MFNLKLTQMEKNMNLYEILEVSENASMETINKIYKIQAINNIK